MSLPKPGPMSLVPFVSVEAMMRLIHEIGVETMLTDIAGYIDEDFRRWEQFDKTPLATPHGPTGRLRRPARLPRASPLRRRLPTPM